MKSKKLNCSYFADRLKGGMPNLHSIYGTKISQSLKSELSRNGYAEISDIKQFIEGIAGGRSLSYMWIDSKDTNKALTFLHDFFSKSTASLDALYQVYGDYDFLIEVVGYKDEVRRTFTAVKEALKNENLLGESHEPMEFEVCEVYRHYGKDIKVGQTNYDTWIINPESFNAILAFTYCYSNLEFQRNRTNRQAFADKVLEKLAATTLKNGFTANGLVNSIYFDKKGNCLIGWLVPCGDFYEFNNATNAMDVLLDVEYRTEKVSYVIAGIYHLVPHGIPLKDTLKSYDSKIVRDATQAIAGLSSVTVSENEVMPGYFRQKAHVSRLRQFKEEITTGVLDFDGTRKNHLLHGPPGSGKTYFVEKLADTISDRCRFFKIELDKCEKSKWERELAKVVSYPGATICLLDEINKKTGDDWPFEILRHHLDANKSGSRNASIVWILAGSEGNDISDLTNNILGRSNGPDCLDRVDNRYSLPEQTALDLIVTTCCIAKNKSKNLRFIEKSALLYLAAVRDQQPMSKYNSPRVIDDRITAAIGRIRPGGDTLHLSCFFGPHESNNFSTLAQTIPDIQRFGREMVIIE